MDASRPMGRGFTAERQVSIRHEEAIGPGIDRRRTAIDEVTTTLLEKFFTRLKEAKEEWAWFVPWIGLWGKAAQIPHKRVVLYLR